jgi:hypothetical protein
VSIAVGDLNRLRVVRETGFYIKFFCKNEKQEIISTEISPVLTLIEDKLGLQVCDVIKVLPDE